MPNCDYCGTDHRDEDGTLIPCLDSITATIAMNVYLGHMS